MNKCGDCACLIKSDGEPYYCAVRDLYTFRDVDDAACEDFVRSSDSEDEQ